MIVRSEYIVVAGCPSFFKALDNNVMNVAVEAVRTVNSKALAVSGLNEPCKEKILLTGIKTELIFKKHGS